MIHETFPLRRPRRERLDGWRLLRFTAMAVPIHAAVQPVIAFVPAILSRDYGIPLAGLGLVFLIGQLINSLLDPVVGTLSDRTVSRFGRRQPWIAGGGVLWIAGCAMLFFPPAGVGLAWVGIGVLLYYAGYSATLTTLLAWSGEISEDYDQRTRIASWFTLLTSGALVLTLLLPALADQLRPDDGPLRLTLFGTLVRVTAVPGLLLTLTAVPDSGVPITGGERFALKKTLAAVFGNRLLLRALAADAVVTAEQGIRAGLLLFIVTTYFQRPEWAAGLFLLQYSFGMFAGSIWHRIGIKAGQRPRSRGGRTGAGGDQFRPFVSNVRSLWPDDRAGRGAISGPAGDCLR